jgi:YD repeat-containing protein
LATLRGTYAFAGVGYDSTFPFSTSGMESYDGQGHLKYTQLWHEGTTFTYNGTGKVLSITTNCVATVIYDGDTTHVWTYFVAPDGSHFYYNNNIDNGLESAGHEDRISLALLVN